MVKLADRITVDPEQCGGRPCIRGMRIRVTDVLDMLAAGASTAEILADYPDLEPEDIEASLKYASRQLDHPIVAARGSVSTRSCHPASAVGWRMSSS